jgi:hypothetical protein
LMSILAKADPTPASHRRGSVWRAHLEPRERATKSHARLVRRTPLPGNNGLFVTKALPSAPRAPSLKSINEGSLLQSEMRSGPRGPVSQQRGGSRSSIRGSVWVHKGTYQNRNLRLGTVKLRLARVTQGYASVMRLPADVPEWTKRTPPR